MAVFVPRWLEEGTARRAAALQQGQFSHPGEEKYHERLGYEPSKPPKGAFEGFEGDPPGTSKIFIPASEQSHEDKFRSFGFVSLSPGEAYMKQIGPFSYVFVLQHEDGKWNVLHETFDSKVRKEKDDDGNVSRIVRRSVSSKQVATNINTFDMALQAASNYLDYLQRQR